MAETKYLDKLKVARVSFDLQFEGTVLRGGKVMAAGGKDGGRSMRLAGPIGPAVKNQIVNRK